MARAFNDDLRRKFLAAYDCGTDGFKTVALSIWVQLRLGAQGRRSAALDQAIEKILPSITAQDAQAWFRLRFGKP